LGEYLTPRIIEAVKAYLTLDDVAEAMRRVFGEYSEALQATAKSRGQNPKRTRAAQ
jgi:hypothetical protein